jgi:hypothetical protein
MAMPAISLSLPKRKQSAKQAHLPPVIAAPLIAISVGIVAFAERDLRTRSATQVRGNKRIWQLASLNALGAIAYLIYGRRKPLPSVPE